MSNDEKMGGKTNQAWTRIFQSLPILAHVNNNGFYDITADEIKHFGGGREPRLMAKMDFREQQPTVMNKNGLALLAIENGIYRIGKFDPYMAIKETPQAIARKISIPAGIISLNRQKLSHESAVLDAANISGALNEAFGERVDLTIRGRSHCPSFSFQLSDVRFPVSGVQVEVDGGYEGTNTINLVEAKIGGRTNISIRQIAYPQLAWEVIAGKVKRVRSFVCFYQAPVLRIIPVAHCEGLWRPDHINERCFQFEDVARVDLYSIKANVAGPLPIIDAPFPQADKFDTVLSMFTLVAGEGSQRIDTETLAESFDITYRQIGYYTSAMRWLGLISRQDGVIELSCFGREVGAMTHAERVEALAKVIFQEPIFNFCLHHPNEPIPYWMFTRWQMSNSTQYRRMRTVFAWIRYFKLQTNNE